MVSSFVCGIHGIEDPATSFLPDFIAKTLDPSVPNPCFDGFTFPLLDDFVGGNRDEFLLCPIRALRKYLSRMEQYHSGIEGLLISTGMIKKRVCQNTISIWLCSVISHAYLSASAEDCRDLWVRAHEVRKVATSLLFGRCAVHPVLKARTWSSQSTFFFYLRDVTHRHMGTFSIGPVVMG